MKEISLNILDVAENSVKARAKSVSITLNETQETLFLSIKDDGCGMKKDFLESVTNPFCTTRTTRKVGLGIPLLKLAAEQTGGYMKIESRHEEEYPDSHGTETSALFYKNHIDFTPLGDVVSSIVTLIHGSPDIDWNFVHTTEKGEVSLHASQLKEILGDIPLNNAEVIFWIEGYLKEQYENLNYS